MPSRLETSENSSMEVIDFSRLNYQPCTPPRFLRDQEGNVMYVFSGLLKSEDGQLANLTELHVMCLDSYMRRNFGTDHVDQLPMTQSTLDKMLFDLLSDAAEADYRPAAGVAVTGTRSANDLTTFEFKIPYTSSSSGDWPKTKRLATVRVSSVGSLEWSGKSIHTPLCVLESEDPYCPSEEPDDVEHDDEYFIF